MSFCLALKRSIMSANSPHPTDSTNGAPASGSPSGIARPTSNDAGLRVAPRGDLLGQPGGACADRTGDVVRRPQRQHRDRYPPHVGRRVIREPLGDPRHRAVAAGHHDQLAGVVQHPFPVLVVAGLVSRVVAVLPQGFEQHVGRRLALAGAGVVDDRYAHRRFELQPTCHKREVKIV